MTDRGYNHGRRQTIRKDNVDVSPESRIPCAYHSVFLLESTPDGAKYIDVYKDALADRRVSGGEGGYDDCGDGASSGSAEVIVVDHDRLVCSLGDKTDDGPEEGYRSVRERAKVALHEDGRIPVALMVQLVHWAIVAGLRQTDAACRRSSSEAGEKGAAVVHVVLTGFFDAAFLTGFAHESAKIRMDAIVELSCGPIARVRDKFVTSATRAARFETEDAVRRFWSEFREGLNVPETSLAFADVVFHVHASRYDALREPPNYDQIVTAARRYVNSEMDRLLARLLDVRREHREKFVDRDDERPTYFVRGSDDGDCAASAGDDCFEFYGLYLAGYPEVALTVPVILCAVIKAVCFGRPVVPEFPDEFFDALTDDGDHGCEVYPACAQYGDEAGITAKKYDLRRTNYAESATYAPCVRWRRSLWGSRPIGSPEARAEHDDVVSQIRRRWKIISGEAGDDPDWPLCVLALNRLRGNLDVFRGEPIEMASLIATEAAFQPELVEPIGCRTMVQVLEAESERYERMSHAYFEAMDAVLVAFYDYQGDADSGRKHSCDFTVPQRSVSVRDYYDYFHGKRTPRCFYAINDARPCVNYTEETKEMRFADGDLLIVSDRKWRFEPGTLCLRYKSKRFEIIRHVADDGGGGGDDDRFRILGEPGCVYVIEKGRRRNSDIRFTGKMADGGTATVEGTEVCLRPPPPSRNVVIDEGRPAERCRRFRRDGTMVVQYVNDETVVYHANGTAVKLAEPKSSEIASTTVRSNRNATAGSRSAVAGSRNATASSRSTVPVSRNATAGSRNATAGSRNATTGSRNAMAGSRNAVRNTRYAARTSRSTVASPETRAEDERPATVDDPRHWTELVLIRYSADGAHRTVQFEDGTVITTCVRQEELDLGADKDDEDSPVRTDDWACYAVYRYEYEHPAYRKVAFDPSDGTASVDGLVRRSADGGLRVRLPRRSGRIDATDDAVRVYAGTRLIRNQPDGPMIATFGWRDRGSGILFERRDRDCAGPAKTTVVRRVRRRYPHRARLEGVVGTQTTDSDGACKSGRFGGLASRSSSRSSISFRPFFSSASSIPSASSAAYFVVKRSMSGFRAVDRREYEWFADLMLRGRPRAAVREDGHEILALFARETDETEPVDDASVGFVDDHQRGYSWLDVRPGSEFGTWSAAVPEVPRLLMFRRFDKSPPIDYRTFSFAVKTYDQVASKSLGTVAALTVRVNAPDGHRALAVYRSMLVNGTLRYDAARDRRFIETLLGRSVRLSVVCVLCRKRERDASEALTRLRTNDFLPYFRREDYGPLKLWSPSDGRGDSPALPT